MLHPFQCILTVQDRYFLAACGPRLTCLDLTTNEIVHDWISDQSNTAKTDSKEAENGERASKKQKTDATEKASSVIKLVKSPDERHIVVVTEDKCVHVFEQHDGKLLEVSQRVMSKKPCAVQILPDNATILVADKFGDVYSMPLIPLAADSGDANAGAEEPMAESKPAPEPKFKPSADFTTIHSKRNRDVLEAQMKQKNFTKKKEPLKFEHKVIMGHVSMLTDLHYMCERSAPQRGYLVTSDRDEHIRVSRGPPQAHIIEGFCLGHTEFVSKICQVGNTNLLVSGGGDDWLGIWDWTRFTLRKKFSLRRLFSKFREDLLPHKFVVSGLWSIDMKTATGFEPAIAVILEGFNGLAILPMETLEMPEDEDAQYTIRGPTYSMLLDEEIVDISWINGPKNTTVVLSLVGGDIKGLSRFIPYSLTRGEDNRIQITSGMHMLDDLGWLEPLSTLDEHVRFKADEKELDPLLHGTANLRKRRDAAPDENGTQDESVLEAEA